MRRWIAPAIVTAGLLGAAAVYAQQSDGPVLDLAGPDGPVITAPPEESIEDALEGALEEPPSTAVVVQPSTALAEQENRASLEIAEELAEEIPPEELEPPPPPPPPMKRPRFASATLMAVDKINAETLRFELKVGTPLRFRGVVFNLRACETTAPDETVRDEMAYLEVIASPLPVAGRPQPEAREIYKGWAFASSPALNPIEHPLYDAWLVECRGKPPQEAANGERPRTQRRRTPRRAASPDAAPVAPATLPPAALDVSPAA